MSSDGRRSARRLKLDASTLSLVRRILRDYVAPMKWRVATAFACMAVVAACTAITSLLMEPIVDQVFIARNSTYLLPVAIAVLATFAAKGTANYFQNVLMSYVGQRMTATLQHDMFRHLLRLDLPFYHANPSGTLMSRFTIDMNMMRNGVSGALTGLGKDSLTATGLIGVMFYQDWVLAAAVFFIFPVAIYPIYRLGRRMRRVSANTQAQLGELSTVLSQSFQGIRHIKAYAMERYEAERAGGLIESTFQLVMKATKVRAGASPIMETLGGIGVAVVILYGGSRVIGGGMPAGAFFSFVFALLTAYEPMKRLAALNTNLQEGLAAADRVFTLMAVRPEISQAPDARALEVSGGTIDFEGVGFSYDGETPALDGVDVRVPGGKTVALVGPSGAGKSTIMNLILRFYDVTDGAVRIDGTDLRHVTLASLRAQIALVSQEISLFDDTIRANIAYGRPGAGEDEIIVAAKHAAAHGFIEELPQGYDTLVGEMGVKLSGGQRQRIAIARAMLKNAPILLLDEATSALDTESERQVQRALDALKKGRTTLVIAHRLSTVVGADLIFVLDRGQVVEHGHHLDLRAAGGLYARLYELQFAGDAGAADQAIGDEDDESLRSAAG